MYYIILDLEWNNTYGRKIKGFINEVIEFGAVMLDEDLNEVDRFSTLVKSQIGRKLRSRVKELTNLTNEDLTSGIEFTKAVSKMRKWIGNRDSCIITWGDSDIRVLIDNCRYLNGINRVPFLQNYADLQLYFQSVMKTPSSRQIGLSAAAEMLNLNNDDYSHHRALDDSLLEAECFKKIFDKEKFKQFIKECNNSFYEKLEFKPYYLSNTNNPLVDKKMFSYICEHCNNPAKIETDWRFVNRGFRAVYYCQECKKKVKVSLTFKKLYDKVEVKKTAVIIIENKNTKIKNDSSSYIVT